MINSVIKSGFKITEKSKDIQLLKIYSQFQGIVHNNTRDNDFLEDNKIYVHHVNST